MNRSLIAFLLLSSGCPTTTMMQKPSASKDSGLHLEILLTSKRAAGIALLYSAETATTELTPLLSQPFHSPKFSMMVPKEGEYILSVIGAGFAGVSDVFEVLTTNDSTIEIKPVTELVELRGSIRSPLGAPIPDAWVRLLRVGGKTAEMYTTAQHHDSWSLNVPAGTYLVSGHHNDYLFRGAITKSSGDSPISLKLRPKPKNILEEEVRPTLVRSIQEFDLDDEERVVPKSVLGAKLIALGEGTHGTAEFFKAKSKLIKQLVESGSVKTVLFEAGWVEALEVNAVLQGTSAMSPREALAGLQYWTWDTEEIVELLEWLREYNSHRESSERVQFFGIDIQLVARGASSLAKALSDLSVSDPVLQVLKVLATDEKFEKRSALEYLTALGSLESITGSLQHATAETKMTAFAILAGLRYSASSGLEKMSIREQVMSQFAVSLAERSDHQAILWAHNEHISFELDSWGFKTIGAELKAALGDRYFAVAFMFGRGSFRAYDGRELGKPLETVRDIQVGKARTGSVEDLFAGLGRESFFLDLRRSPELVRTWAQTPRFLRSIGSIFRREGRMYKKFALIENWDAVIYFDTTTAARSTSTGERPRRPKK